METMETFTKHLITRDYTNVSQPKKNWIMTYNDCEYIRALYKGYKIIEVDWKYGMNATKKSSEIVIIGRSTHVEEIVGAMVKRVIQEAAA